MAVSFYQDEGRGFQFPVDFLGEFVFRGFGMGFGDLGLDICQELFGGLEDFFGFGVLYVGLGIINLEFGGVFGFRVR